MFSTLQLSAENAELEEVRMKKLQAFTLGVFLLGLLFLTGCEMLLLDAVMDFNLSLEPAQTTISKGASQDITVKVSRILPVNVAPTPITVKLYNPPDGITLEGEQVDIPSGLDERVLTIEVSDGALLGDHELTIEGSTGLKTKQVKLNLTVE
jgi:uncharacterized membrane protein